jgi:1-deoxy-D-xylulose-5-phosphate reductoisomerase
VRGVALLGSTGSIGQSALRVLARQRGRFRVAALTAHHNAALLAEQAADTGAEFVGLTHPAPGVRVPAEWRTGAGALVDAATHPSADVVLNAVVGAAGLRATLAALGAGRRVALANKESLVVAGPLVTACARQSGGELVPVDSEHSAILQCIAGRPGQEVRRLVLTASGGPFRTWPAERLAAATVGDALRHPTWSMGQKITIDSATLANKALEVIEAHHLFGVPYDRIDVVVHPQSVVHSFVEFCDGSVLAQMGRPTMDCPSCTRLTHPGRVPDTGLPPFDPVALGPLTFEAVRAESFPMLGLGVAAGAAGRRGACGVQRRERGGRRALLDGRIGFAGTPVDEGALEGPRDRSGATLDDLLAAGRPGPRPVRAHAPMRRASGPAPPSRPSLPRESPVQHPGPDRRVRDHRVRARARALPRREARRRVRAAFLHRLRARPLPPPTRGDRVRDRGAPARRVRADGLARGRSGRFLEGGGEQGPDAVPTTGGNAAGKTVDDHAGAPHRGADWDPRR